MRAVRWGCVCDCTVRERSAQISGVHRYNAVQHHISAASPRADSPYLARKSRRSCRKQIRTAPGLSLQPLIARHPASLQCSDTFCLAGSGWWLQLLPYHGMKRSLPCMQSFTWVIIHQAGLCCRMTGTAVNPCLRAAFLAKREDCKVMTARPDTARATFVCLHLQLICCARRRCWWCHGYRSTTRPRSSLMAASMTPRLSKQSAYAPGWPSAPVSSQTLRCAMQPPPLSFVSRLSACDHPVAAVRRVDAVLAALIWAACDLPNQGLLTGSQQYFCPHILSLLPQISAPAPGGSPTCRQTMHSIHDKAKASARRVQVVWFAGRYDAYVLGILPVGDVTQVIPPGRTELVILDEPEHLTWHHHGAQWTRRFSHVVRTALPEASVHSLPSGPSDLWILLGSRVMGASCTLWEHAEVSWACSSRYDGGQGSCLAGACSPLLQLCSTLGQV